MSFHPNEIARRGRVVTIAVFGIFGLLLLRFFSMQILLHAQYTLQSDKNRLNEIPLPAARGIIYDRNGAVIAENLPGYTVAILTPRDDSLRAILARVGARIPLSPTQIAVTVHRHRVNPQRPTVLYSDAPFDIVSILEEHRVEFPGLIIESSPKRHYPDSAAVSGFVGYTSDISEDVLASDRGVGYKAGQQIGTAGLERQYETVLRGQEGSRFVEVDSRGRVVRDAGVRAELPPLAGPALRTNIDLDLQRFVAKIFGDSLVGAAVVMEPTTGAVLALHSAPGYDPNLFIGGISTEKYDALLKDPRRPLVNKAVYGTYAPGSTWKLATTIMALQRGLVGFDQRMEEPCTGGFQFYDRVFHCEKRDGHGALNLMHAIEQSCDIYFYQLGIKIGFKNLVAAGDSMLFGDTTNIDLPNEQSPDFPPVNDSLLKAYYNKRFGREGVGWTRQAEALFLSIGQGANSQTVVNMARFYTALATDGRAARPELVTTDVVRKRIFQLSNARLDSLRMAMTGVVSQGTAASAAIKDIAMAGKTGTAQNVGADHGWFVGFAPVSNPRIVVAVLLEHGLHGSRAARIAGKIVEHYLKVSILPPPTPGAD